MSELIAEDPQVQSDFTVEYRLEPTRSWRSRAGAGTPTSRARRPAAVSGRFQVTVDEVIALSDK